MSCSIILENVRTTISQQSSKLVEKTSFSGSALQSPELSRLALNALMRREMRVRQSRSRLFWTHFRKHNVPQNANSAEPVGSAS